MPWFLDMIVVGSVIAWLFVIATAISVFILYLCRSLLDRVSAGKDPFDVQGEVDRMNRNELNNMTDYDVLVRAQWRGNKIPQLARIAEFAWGIVVARGLDPTKPISPSTSGYPPPPRKYAFIPDHYIRGRGRLIHVKQHIRRYRW